MRPNILDWETIADDFTDGLVLGNGASIAFDKRFSYPSLKQAAVALGRITPDLDKIFDFLRTSDFELVLRVLWHADAVNQALSIEDHSTRLAYASVRAALVEAVRDVHATHALVSARLPAAGSFMARFQTVLSLNYDLLVYWAAMSINSAHPHRFKDCFRSGRFDSDWKWMRKPYGDRRNSSLIFYPHGNLVIAADIAGVESKLTTTTESSRLLEAILQSWMDGTSGPVFVSEGSSPQKLRSIRRSTYLSAVYDTVLPDLGHSAVFFGWSLSDVDQHIVDAILKNKRLERIAVGVMADDHMVEERCARINRTLGHGSALDDTRRREVIFFDATSDGCWLSCSEPIVS